MKKARNRKGSMIAFSAMTAFVITLLGVGFYFVVRIFGGERELQHATDAGNLDIAKQALGVAPTVSPILKPVPGVSDPLIVQKNFGPLITEEGGNVSLKTYNRLAGQALIVAANASRLDNLSPLATFRAGELIKALQGSDKSVGGQLKGTLSSNSSAINSLMRKQVFNQTSNNNSVRMLNTSSNSANTVSEDRNAYDVSYVAQMTKSDGSPCGATNMEIPPGIRLLGLLPASMMVQGRDNKTYLAGYTKLDLPVSRGAVGSIVGVPVQPSEQPHIISQKNFDEGQLTTSRLGPNVFVPPNSFKSKAQSAEVTSGMNAQSTATAITGCLTATYPLAIPYGYIQITNDAGTSVPGIYNNLDNILANELVTPPGILVSGNFFTTNQNLLNLWAVYNTLTMLGKPPGLMPPAPPFGSNAIFNLQTGQPATQAQLMQLPHTLFKPVITAACTDTNTLSPSANPNCKNNAMTFQRAYYPGSTAFGTFTPRNPNNLMAVECMKCQLQRGYPQESTNVFSIACRETGLRVYNPTQLVRSHFGDCKVSRPGTVRELGNQVSAGFGNIMIERIIERATEIAPTNPVLVRKQVMDLIDSTTVDMGETKYLYLANPAELGRKGLLGIPRFVLSSQPPIWRVPNTAADGSTILFKRTNMYDAVNNGGSVSSTTPTNYAPFINTHHDGGIHDVPYEAGPDNTPGVVGIDTALFQPSSGYNNLLGVVSFKNQAMGSGVNFNSPN